MEVSLNWLRKYVDLPDDVPALSSALTSLGLEVEGTRSIGGLDGVVAAEVLECARHPEADKLSLCRVSDGTETYPVVCGAPNVAKGQKVLLAKVGAELPAAEGGTFRIKKAKIRGAESLGMICAEDEVGLGEGHEGILVLDASIKAGTPMKSIPGLSDTVFELNVTPNRPDALCHLGVARELAAKLGKPLRYPTCALQEAGPDAASLASVKIEDIAGCTRYVGRVIQGVKVGPSPAWLVNALKSLGKRSINNVVDLTNYVLLELGQPSHAFDLDRIRGSKVIIRKAAPGERLTTLDGVERKLAAEDLVIADAEGPMVLAGVMGGKDSEVSPETKDIFLELAYFNPAHIRRQGKRHGLSSDSSFRFERGVDPLHTAQVSDYLAALIAEWCGGAVAKGRVQDASPEHPQSPRVVFVRPARVEKLMGVHVDSQEVIRRLESIGLRRHETAHPHGEKAYAFAIPGFRGDLEREADLIEEVARLGDYNNIPAILPVLPIGVTEVPPLEALSRRIRQSLKDAGLNETLNLRFSSRKALAKLGLPAGHPRAEFVPLRNPLSEEWEILPSTSLPSLLQAAAHNRNNQERDIRFFEIAKSFYHRPSERTDRLPGVREEDLLHIVLAGEWPDRRPWSGDASTAAPVEFHHLKGLLENLLASLGVQASLASPSAGPSGPGGPGPVGEPYLHPRESGSVMAALDGANLPAVLLGQDHPQKGQARIGGFGVLHPRVLAAFDLRGPVLVAEISLQGLLSAARKDRKFQPFAHFSAVSRDLNLLVEEAVTHGDIVGKIPANRIPNLTDIRLNSVYRGQGVPEGRKALHYSFTYRNNERTLTDEEVNKAQDKLRAELAKDPGIVFK